MSHRGQGTDESSVTARVTDGWLSHFKEVGILENLTQKISKWLWKTTVAGMIPLLLMQVLIALFCVPETLNADTEIRREMTMEELRDFLSGEDQLTVLLSEGGAVRGDVIAVQDHGIHLGRVTMATDGTRFHGGGDAIVPKALVKEICFDSLQGSQRMVLGPLGFGSLGYIVGKEADRVTIVLTIAD